MRQRDKGSVQQLQGGVFLTVIFMMELGKQADVLFKRPFITLAAGDFSNCSDANVHKPGRSLQLM